MKVERIPSLGGKARARKLSAEKRKEIARKGADAIRGKTRTKRGPYKKRKKPKGQKQKLYELLVNLHDHLAYGWRIYPTTPIGKGPDTVAQRVAELLRIKNKKKRSQAEPKTT